MAYQTIRRNGRNITIDTATGQEVGIGQGRLKPVFDKLGLSNLNETLPLTLKQMGADIQNLPGDISRHLIYSDKVDEKGRPLTIAQAYPKERQVIPEIKAYLAGKGKSQQELPSRPPASGTKIKIDDKYYDTGYHSAEIAALRKKYPGGGNAAQSQSINEGRNAYIPTPPIQTPTPAPTKTGPKLDPNATERFKTAFNAGKNNMDQIQAMYADGPKYKDTGKTALQIWAEANPALAQKEYLKKTFNDDGTPKILDKTVEGFDKPDAPGTIESINGMELPQSISINATNQLLDNMSEADDSQEFLKNYIMSMKNK